MSEAAMPIRRSVSVPTIALSGLAALVLWLGATVGVQMAVLMVIGGALGVVLYHAAFGFTGAFRAFITDGHGRGLRAQMLMFGVAVVLFFPVLASGMMFGTPVEGNVAPVGIGLVVGAFLFGLGMQLGGGCASGTLFTAGGGNTRMMITLLFFIVGSVIGTVHAAWWHSLPAFEPVSIVHVFGPALAIVISLLVFAAIAAFTVVVEKRRHGELGSGPEITHKPSRWLRGPWPLLFGAVALALLNFATLAFKGSPWGITSGFALWGTKVFTALGGDVAGWGYWQVPAREHALDSSIWTHATSVMDIGIILGALAAAGLAGRFAPKFNIPLRSIIAAVIGGLLLGYGARLAFGCNIGAYFGGIVSGSLHGWAWLVAAFVGNMLGVKIRPLFIQPSQASGA